MLPAASTLMRHWVAVAPIANGAMVSAPSFGTPETSGDHVFPPSVESRMFTVGATEPPPTVQVTFMPPVGLIDSPPFGAFTTNGLPLTVTSMESSACAPVGRWLSRTVQTNFISRFTVGSASYGSDVFASTVESFGNQRVGFVVGSWLRNSGPYVRLKGEFLM